MGAHLRRYLTPSEVQRILSDFEAHPNQLLLPVARRWGQPQDVAVSDAISEGAKLAGSYCWASNTRAHGMQTPEEMEAQGWTRLSESPRWPGSWWMWKRNEEATQ